MVALEAVVVRESIFCKTTNPTVLATKIGRAGSVKLQTIHKVNLLCGLTRECIKHIYFFFNYQA